RLLRVGPALFGSDGIGTGGLPGTRFPLPPELRLILRIASAGGGGAALVQTRWPKARSEATIALGSGVWGISPIAARSFSPEMRWGTRQRYSSSANSRLSAIIRPTVLMNHQFIRWT